MKHVLSIVLLLSIISSSLLYCVFYIFFNLVNPANSINQTFRKTILQQPQLRKSFRLEQVGDARYEYFHNPSMPLIISLYYEEGISLDPKTLEIVNHEVRKITHKNVIILQKPQTIINVPSKIQDTDIAIIEKKFGQDTSVWSNVVPLSIFLLSYYTPHPSYAGLVTDAHSIILFNTAIENVTTNPESRSSMEIGTILHEFAHLGGAEHIQNQDCILAETVENLNFFQKISHITNTYCEEDIKEIRRVLE